MFITYKYVLSNKPLTASEAYQKLLKSRKQYSGSFPRGGAFEQLFCPVRSEFEQYFSKNSNARGFARGDVEASI